MTLAVGSFCRIPGPLCQQPETVNDLLKGLAGHTIRKRSWSQNKKSKAWALFVDPPMHLYVIVGFFSVPKRSSMDEPNTYRINEGLIASGRYLIALSQFVLRRQRLDEAIDCSMFIS